VRPSHRLRLDTVVDDCREIADALAELTGAIASYT